MGVGISDWVGGGGENCRKIIYEEIFVKNFFIFIYKLLFFLWIGGVVCDFMKIKICGVLVRKW